ncbi:hypothetical protein SLEP1_g36169 [Rubroshorea leprosula]|uniref:Uncharacterized protein n=1 Tax=Rubroshorea leprosula TaxID=152421 RepID=A0AAV5KR17_9ROSI|nr:hypothetical protein SLEP1_g36169 [Rubroshorea leprosula]
MFFYKRSPPYFQALRKLLQYDCMAAIFWTRGSLK